MDIRQFSPQTQRTLSKMDFNRDQQLSTRELDVLKNMPSVPGIAPKDLAQIQEALKKSKGPEQIIVKLVEDDLPPGYKNPEPVFREKAAKPATPPATPPATKQPNSQASAQASTQPNAQINARPTPPATPGNGQTPDKPAAKKGAGKVVEQAPVTFKATAKTTPAKGAAHGEPDSKVATGADFQTTARFGAVQLQGTTSVGDEGRTLGGKVSARYEPADSMGLEVGFEGAPASDTKTEKSDKSKTGSTKASGSAKTPKAPTAPVSAPTNTQLPENLTLNGKLNAGPVKLTAKAKLNAEGSPAQNLSTGAEVKVAPGHALRAETKQVQTKNGVSWGAVKLGSSHQVASGLSLTTSTQLGDAGKPNKYGAGFSYDHGNGLNLEAEALTRADTTYTRPVQTLQSLDLKLGFRYRREF